MLNHTLKMDIGTDRHLIVGDLHGRYDQFMQLLEIANYDPVKDIIYSVGDMIDRGPKSVECVEFFQQERCYAIKGNHELMMLDSDWTKTWLDNGGVACLNSTFDRKMDIEVLKNLVRNLPWVIDVGEDDEEHAFRIIHAEMPPEWSETYFQSVLDSAINHSDTTFSKCIWSRNLIQKAGRNAEALRPTNHKINFHKERFRTVFTGHTPCNKAFMCGDHRFLDTWLGNNLTLQDAITKETFTIDLY